MSLASYTPPSTTVELPRGGSLTVRGLAAEDISTLLRRHGQELETLYAKAVSGEIPEKAVAAMMMQTVLQSFPYLAADIIALAADEPENYETAAKLPLPTQMTLLTAIFNNTFETEDDVKNFLAAFVTAAQKFQKLLGLPAVQLSGNGSPGSAGK